jgi:hypothetical protein
VDEKECEGIGILDTVEEQDPLLANNLARILKWLC